MSYHLRDGARAGTNGIRSAPYSGNHYNQNSDDDDEAEPPYTAILQSVPLGTDEENCRLLDQVDKLRECGVDEYIDLPQIVVVGDQSSGKSSILEALTNIPFPRKSVKCTRFATQIRLRRAVQVRRVIRIQPHIDCKPAEREILSKFEENIGDEHDFDTIFQRAMDAIFPKNVESQRFLSRNTLSIEVSGPEQPHLTVVDLPGFIHSPSMNQTAEDIADIEALAKQYMRKERTIVLPVVSADIEYSKQVVLRTIKELDPKGIRTLGIITKPDMTPTEMNEKEFISLASNKDKKNKLQLGWHVLRNRTPKEMDFSPEERKNAEAEFFANSNWSRELKADQLGIDALSKRLSTQLIRHIAAEVFKVEADIDRELERCREMLRDLGDGIDTTEEMRSALYSWCERSARLTHAALEGNGVNPPREDFFPSFDDGRLYARNFRSRVVKENHRFAEEMEKWGSSCLIIEEDSQRGKSATRFGDVGSSLPEIKRSDYIKQEVIPLLRDNPGKELAMDSNSLLVYRLFHSYSTNWGKLAMQHMEAIHRLCEEFLVQVLDYAWPKRIESRIWAGFIKIKTESMRQNAADEMKKLLADRMRLITPYESELLRQWYESQGFDATDRGPISPEEQQYENFLRKMLWMYQSKLGNFVMNVISQVVERHIADGLEEVFHDRRVRALDDDQVKALVEDDYHVRTERQELRTQESTFAQGKDICREISRRPDLGPYEYQDPRFQERDSSTSQYRERRNGKGNRQKTSLSQKYNYPSADFSPGNLQENNTSTSASASPGVTAYGLMRSSKQKALSPPTRPAPENSRSPGTRPPIPTTSDDLNEQTYLHWPDPSVNYDNGRSGEMDHDEAASTTSVPRGSQSEEAVAGATLTSKGHARKTSKNLRTTLGLGKKKDNLSQD
ncbi:MAG: hypothetical protein M1839_004458 [Geoglossum umbratile]|nr:MAG: hypothetical protein M1839_004458 [Geoglossum umbratile]